METIDNYTANTILNFCDFNTKLNLILANKIFSLNCNKNALLIDFLKEELQINFYDEIIKDYYFQKIAIELNKYNIDPINYKYNNFFKSSSLEEQRKVIRFLSMNLLNLVTNNNKNIVFWQILILNYILELRKKKTSIIYSNIKFQNNILVFCKNNDNIIISKLINKILTTIP